MKKPIVIDLRSQHHLVQRDIPKCPYCGCNADGATGGNVAPVPGNLSVCIRCAGVGIWEGPNGKMKLVRVSEEIEKTFDEETLTKLKVLQTTIRAMHASKKKNK